MLRFARSYLRVTAALPFAMAALVASNASPARGGAQYKVLYTFQGGPDGDTPNGKLVVDSAGNLYGATSRGGTGDCAGPGQGCGVVFEITGAR